MEIHDPDLTFFDFLRSTPGVESMDLHLAEAIAARCIFPPGHEILSGSPLAADSDFPAGSGNPGKSWGDRLSPREVVALTVVLASVRLRMGHVFLDLGAYSGRLISIGSVDDSVGIFCPVLDEWLRILFSAGASTGECCPLVADGNGRIYLRRYLEYEVDLARRVADMALHRIEVDSWAAKTVEALFFDAPAGDLQRLAAMSALDRRFLVIAGGPGTGKTTTVSRILAAILSGQIRSAAGGPGGGCRIVLAAPTGKAAARLQESIAASKETLGKILAPLGMGEEILGAIPDTASTLHRLIGQVPGATKSQRNADNPIPADIIVVDEASMVDLAMMTRLFQALPAGCRLILLGDADQLASVEAGSVLRDLCEASGEFVITLTQSRRFVSGSGIGELARAVNRSDFDRVMEVLESPGYGDVRLIPLPQAGKVDEFVAGGLAKEFVDAALETSAEKSFAIFERFRILSAMRQGPFGAVRLNAAVMAALVRRGVISPAPDGSQWFNGRPVLVTGNDYGTGLFNGDVGVVLSGRAGNLSHDSQGIDSENKSHEGPRVFFQGPQGMRSFIPAMLPAHETAYAMTIHKSQGSEFDTVAVFLPDRDSPVLNRELLYTAITRARNNVLVVSSRKTLAACLARRTERATGLAERVAGLISPAKR